MVGQFVSESGVAKGIGRIHGGRVFGYQADSHERAQQRGRQDISHLVDQLGIRKRDLVIESSHRIYKLALQKGFTRGRRTNQVAAACIYIICRQENEPFLLIDFAESLQIDVFTLGGVFLQLTRLLRLDEHPIFIRPVDPSLYIHRFVERMELDDVAIRDRITQTSMKLVASMKRDWIQTGRRPSGVCGAALFIAAHLHGIRRRKHEIVEIVNIGAHTLSKRLVEFSHTDAATFSKKGFLNHVDTIESQEKQLLASAESIVHPPGTIANCEHISLGEPHFRNGMCRECFKIFVEKTGGTFDGCNPPSYKPDEVKDDSTVLALPAPSTKDVSTEPDSEIEHYSGVLTRNSKKVIKDKKRKEMSEEKHGENSNGNQIPPLEKRRAEGELAESPRKYSKKNDNSSKSDAKRFGGVSAEDIAAAELEVQGFDEAIAEAEKKAKNRKMSLKEFLKYTEAKAIAAAAEDTGEAASGIDLALQLKDSSKNSFIQHAMESNPDTVKDEAIGRKTNGDDKHIESESNSDGDGENRKQEDEDSFSDIDDDEIDIYIATHDEIKYKEEIWNLMNQDWVEKQEAKKAALAAAERAQAEQRAAMEAAEAAGIAYKRGRGRPLGSKTKPRPELKLPPADTPEEATMRMLDQKKLSSKINYSVLADLFSEDIGTAEDTAMNPENGSQGGLLAATYQTTRTNDLKDYQTTISNGSPSLSPMEPQSSKFPSRGKSSKSVRFKDIDEVPREALRMEHISASPADLLGIAVGDINSDGLSSKGKFVANVDSKLSKSKLPSRLVGIGPRSSGAIQRLGGLKEPSLEKRLGSLSSK